MNICILQTAPNNCEKLAEIIKKYPDVRLINYVDEVVWEHVLNNNGKVNDKVHELLAADFNKMIEAGCDRLGLLCSLVKPGIEKVRAQVPLPIIVYDDVQAERAVAVTPDGGRIAVIAQKEAPLEPSAQAVREAAERAGKTSPSKRYASNRPESAFSKRATPTSPTDILKGICVSTRKSLTPMSFLRCP